MVTIGDVAAKAGVSKATVSFVLGNRADDLKISRQTRDRVFDVARELGYQRNQLARAMVTGKSRILGVLTTPHAMENIILILMGAMEAASKNDYLLKVVHLSFEDFDDATLARCLEWRLAGALVAGFSDAGQQRLHDAFREHNVPAAFTDNVRSVNSGIRVSSDDEQGIRLVVSHLVELGHRRIAFLGGRPGSVSEWRERSFRTVIADAGLSVPEHWIRHSSWQEREIIETQAHALFAESGDCLPTAVVCAADTVAMVVIRIARSRGLRLPKDLSVTGYSNASLANFMDPLLTTVDQSFYEMGHVAVLQIIGSIESGKTGDSLLSQNILLPTRLIERESTASPPLE